MKIKLPLLGLALVALLTTAGCAPDYDHTEFTGTRSSKLGGSVDRTQIIVPEGMIVTSHIVPFNDDDKVMAAEVRTKDETILGVQHVIRANDFAFVGNKVGTTEIEIVADNELVMTITATVVPQTTP